MEHDIYFHADKYRRAIKTELSLYDIQSRIACNHVKSLKIFININKLMNVGHNVLDSLPDFNAKFNLAVSHEVIHQILNKITDKQTSKKFDRLTVNYWYKKIDIGTNYDLM